jgi:hypothetical protein
MHAGFSDPGGPSRVGHSGGPPYSLADSVLPSAVIKASAATISHISGLILLSSHFPLSTLRDRVTPVVTQDSLPAGNLSLAGQSSNLQGSFRWFLLCFYICFLHLQACPGARSLLTRFQTTCVCGAAAVSCAAFE